MRENILTLLGISFQRIHKAVLGSYLALQPAELDKLVRGGHECGGGGEAKAVLGRMSW